MTKPAMCGSKVPFLCISCGREIVSPTATCDECGGFVRYAEGDSGRLRRAVNGAPTAALPRASEPVRMGEGETPTTTVGHELDPTVVGKLESLNPSCSFKDRGSSLIVSQVASPETRWEAVVVASTGNTATSVSAYAARADVPCAVLVPDGTSAAKLGQAAAHGAKMFTVDGTFSDAFRLAQEVSSDRILNATAVYSANPFVASANRTVAFELVNDLGGVPDWVTVPVGAGPLLGGTYFGFRDLVKAGVVDSVPRMICVQADGCHPIVRAFEQGKSVEPWRESISTTVGAIADPLVGYASDGDQTLQAVLESDGTAIALDDHHIERWTKQLAERAGVYAEPASAAAVAAIERVDAIDAGDTVAALITGHGLKERQAASPSATNVGNDPSAVQAALVK